MIEKIALALLALNIIGTLVLWTRDKHMLYALYAGTILAFFVMSTYSDMTPEWKQHQYKYKELLQANAQTDLQKEQAENMPIQIRQIWNRELGVADRCTTCHLGVDNPSMADAPAPFKYHPVAHVTDDGMVIHQFNDIGCTICHEGQGLATTEYKAHGIDVPHWERPMYPVGERGMVQASCSKCHESLAEPENWEPLEGAEMINMARDYSDGANPLEADCRGCHAIYGVGEVLAPDLTAYGESTAHDFEATHIMNFVEGKRDKYSWTFQHFIDPQKVTPDNEELGIEETIMPNFEMTEEQAHFMTTWVYSMKESSVPVKYRYRPAVKRAPSVAQQIAGLYTPEEFAELSRGEKLFIRNNCWICHTIHGKGGKLGPDLSKVGTRRDEAWMVKHFKDPRSVSQKSFMPKFNLSDEQIAEVVDYLKTLR